MSESQILQTLMNWRSRVSAAVWIVVRDAHAAEDIFQNVALKALTKDVTFDNDASLLSWAFITARREGLDWLHRHRREVVSLRAELLEILERDWQSPSHTSDESRLGALETCLEATPEDSRRLLKLRYFDGLACQEVATKLGINLDTIYKRLSRLHESLRQCIEGKLATAKPPGVAAQ